MRRTLILLFLTLALGGCRDDSSTSSSPSFQAKTRLFFLGIDGATWTVLGPMLERGELPAFQRLVREGTSLPRLDTLQVTESPVIWTTVATGQRPLYHNIRGFTARLPNGHLIPVTSSQRRARAIWELANRRGLSVGRHRLVGHLAGREGQRLRGQRPRQPGLRGHDDRRAPLLDRGPRRPGRAAPAGLSGGDRARPGPPLDHAGDLSLGGLPAPRRLHRRAGPAARQAPWNERDLYSWLKTFYRLDYPLLRVALDLMRERPTDLQMLYLRGPDPVQHYGWDLVEPEKFARKPANLERDRDRDRGDLPLRRHLPRRDPGRARRRTPG